MLVSSERARGLLMGPLKAPRRPLRKGLKMTMECLRRRRSRGNEEEELPSRRMCARYKSEVLCLNDGWLWRGHEGAGLPGDRLCSQESTVFSFPWSLPVVLFFLSCFFALEFVCPFENNTLSFCWIQLERILSTAFIVYHPGISGQEMEGWGL